MTQRELNEVVKISVQTYGKDATIEALNKMYHDKLITLEQVIKMVKSDTLK